jgi:hypothetical protein
VNVAGAVLDDDQGVDAPEEHGVHVDEIDREDAVGLGGEELIPGRCTAPELDVWTVTCGLAG